VLNRLRAVTAKRSIFNFSFFGDRPLFHGEVLEDNFKIEWIPRQGVLWGPSIAGEIVPVDGETVVHARLRPTVRVLAAGVLLLFVFPLSIAFTFGGFPGPGIVGVLICSTVIGMNVYVAKSALSALRNVLGIFPTRA
jgi:hypothetical protein